MPTASVTAQRLSQTPGGHHSPTRSAPRPWRVSCSCIHTGIHTSLSSILLVSHLSRRALLVRVHFGDALGDAGRQLGALLLAVGCEQLGDRAVVMKPPLIWETWGKPSIGKGSVSQQKQVDRSSRSCWPQPVSDAVALLDWLSPAVRACGMQG